MVGPIEYPLLASHLPRPLANQVLIHSNFISITVFSRNCKVSIFPSLTHCSSTRDPPAKFLA